jgi:hypothetical protein
MMVSPDVATVDSPWTIDDAVMDQAAAMLTDETVREIALALNPYVKIGDSPPVKNLAPAGWLRDVVDKLGGWDEAEAKYPEITAFCGRLRSTLTGVLAGVIAARQ